MKIIQYELSFRDISSSTGQGRTTYYWGFGRRRPVPPPSSNHRRRPSAQESPDQPFGPRCLLRRCQRNSSLKTSNIVGLKFGSTGQRLEWTGKRFGWTGGNPRRRLSVGGERSSARAQKDDQQVWRAASRRLLTEDEAWHEQWKMLEQRDMC